MSELQALIRQKRTEKGLSQEQLGALANVSASSIGSYETGRLIPVPDIAAALDGVFETGDRIQRLSAQARGQSLRSFIRSWAEHEQQATVLRSFELAVVPGLLQTETYARRLLTDVGPVEDVESEVAGRLARQEVITRADKPARFIAVIDRSVLHRQIGSPDEMAEQLQAVVTACDRPNVWVHVVPSGADAYIGLNGPFALATVHSRVLGYLDTHLGGGVVDDPDAVQVLERAWEGCRSYALPVAESRDMILKAVELWT
jgi:transcriptional regulator with XRE-family HTH domain